MKQTISIREFPIPLTYTAENALLGALIERPSAIYEVRKYVDAKTFSDQKNAALWALLCEMDVNGEAISTETVYHRVDAKHYTDNILPYIVERSVFDILEKANALIQLSTKRDIYFHAVNALRGSCTETDAGAIVADLTEFCDSINSRSTDDGIRHISKVNDDLGDVLQQRQVDREAGKKTRVPTGLPRLDWLTYGGLGNGNLVILAARPSVGKTAFMLQMARTSAEAGIPSLVFSLEMTNLELAQRINISTGLVQTRDLINGSVDWTAFEQATGKFADVPLWFTDSCFRINEIVAKITTAHKQGKCDIAYIDYLGLIDGDEKQDLRLQVTYCTKRLKRLAKECNIPIVLLCQLNRDMSKEGREPQMHDLRESGSIEQDADIILMLARNREQDDKSVTMFVRKNRQGELGQAEYRGENGYTTFYEIEQATPTTSYPAPEDPYYNNF